MSLLVRALAIAGDVLGSQGVRLLSSEPGPELTAETLAKAQSPLVSTVLRLGRAWQSEPELMALSVPQETIIFSASSPPAFAELPGLLAKIWLADPASGMYGGVYQFSDTGAADAFTESRLFRTVALYPNFTDLIVRRFTVDEKVTRRTQPRLGVVPTRAVTLADALDQHRLNRSGATRIVAVAGASDRARFWVPDQHGYIV